MRHSAWASSCNILIFSVVIAGAIAAGLGLSLVAVVVFFKLIKILPGWFVLIMFSASLLTLRKI